MPQRLLRPSINALNANVAILDRAGLVIDVNDHWRRFGKQRKALSDYVGLNYVDVCAKAAAGGDVSAKRVELGLRRLLAGEAETFGVAYHCGDRTFRMQARMLSEPLGGLLIAHEDITALLKAIAERYQRQRSSKMSREAHAARSDKLHEEVGQRLTAISLAAGAIEAGGDIANAITLIRIAVEEARHELKLHRYDARQSLAR